MTMHTRVTAEPSNTKAFTLTATSSPVGVTSAFFTILLEPLQKGRVRKSRAWVNHINKWKHPCKGKAEAYLPRTSKNRTSDKWKVEMGPILSGDD